MSEHKTEEKRIYCVVAGTIKTSRGVIIQPSGRQIAQACHAVSKLRHSELLSLNAHLIYENPLISMTTIILQARDSYEMDHVNGLLRKRKLYASIFSDDNPEYGPGSFPTALAVFATKSKITGILDYLPLWGSK